MMEIDGSARPSLALLLAVALPLAAAAPPGALGAAAPRPRRA